MKKALLLFLLSMTFCARSQQSAYYDAMFVAKHCISPTSHKFTNPNSLYPILIKYYPAGTNVLPNETLRKNPFFAPYVPAGSIQSVGEDAVYTTKALANPGGLDVTNIANGVADFMIARAKEELSISFFNRFKNFTDDHAEFRVLFPKTTENLVNLLSYQYAEMLPVLRSGFADDIGRLPLHLDDLLELPQYAFMLKDFPEVRVMIKSIKLVAELERSELNVAEVMQQFADFSEWSADSLSEGTRNTGNALKLSAVFSSSLRSSTEGRVWINPAEVKELINNKDAFAIYLGFVYQVTDTLKISFSENGKQTFFTEVLAKQKDNFFTAQNKVEEFIDLADRVERELTAIHGKQPTRQDYCDYINTAAEVMDYAFSLAALMDPANKTTNYAGPARKATQLYKNLYNKEYPQAVDNSLDILADVFAQVEKSPRYLALVQDNKKSIENLNKFIDKVRRYGLFMANVAVARSSEEVKAALEAAVLPAGSSSVKKNTCFNIAIQSYLGAYGLLSKPGGPASAWNDSYGIIAPIGLAFSHGLGKAGSVSLFPTLFDLGAIVDYRLNTDSVANTNGTKTQEIRKDYKIQLGQLFSPGAYLVYGMAWNFPLSLGVGGQYGPGLSKINAAGKTQVLNPSWRWNVFLSVDIPLFNLCTVRKKS